MIASTTRTSKAATLKHQGIGEMQRCHPLLAFISHNCHSLVTIVIHWSIIVIVHTHQQLSQYVHTKPQHVLYVHVKNQTPNIIHQKHIKHQKSKSTRLSLTTDFHHLEYSNCTLTNTSCVKNAACTTATWRKKQLCIISINNNSLSYNHQITPRCTQYSYTSNAMHTHPTPSTPHTHTPSLPLIPMVTQPPAAPPPH